MYSIELNATERMNLEIALVDLLEALRDNNDEEGYEVVESLLNKVTSASISL